MFYCAKSNTQIKIRNTTHSGDKPYLSLLDDFQNGASHIQKHSLQFTSVLSQHLTRLHVCVAVLLVSLKYKRFCILNVLIAGTGSDVKTMVYVNVSSCFSRFWNICSSWRQIHYRLHKGVPQDSKKSAPVTTKVTFTSVFTVKWPSNCSRKNLSCLWQ